MPRDDTCPKIFEANSENEYWAKAGSLLHTTTRGKDLADPANVRFYLLSSLPTAPETARAFASNRAIHWCRDRLCVLCWWPWMNGWRRKGASREPRSAPEHGTLVASLPQAGEGFPVIEGVTYNGRLHEGDLLNYGETFDQGLFTRIPPKFLGSPYPALVPKTDPDGNDIAGIRMVDVAVPTATYTGWALRAGPAAGDGCDAAGQKIDSRRRRRSESPRATRGSRSRSATTRTRRT